MSIGEALAHIGANYPKASTETFASHPLAVFIRAAFMRTRVGDFASQLSVENIDRRLTRARARTTWPGHGKGPRCWGWCAASRLANAAVL
jgi:hypothetical protein